MGSFVDDTFVVDGFPSPGDISDPDAGVEVYYNAQHGNWVLSPYLSVTIPVQESDSMELDVNYAGSAGVRAGYAFGRWLPYAFLGGFAANVTTSFTDDTNTHLGYTAGAGLNYAHGDRLVLGGRYNHYWVGEETYAGLPGRWFGHSIVGTVSFKLH